MAALADNGKIPEKKAQFARRIAWRAEGSPHLLPFFRSTAKHDSRACLPGPTDRIHDAPGQGAAKQENASPAEPGSTARASKPPANPTEPAGPAVKGAVDLDQRPVPPGNRLST